MIRAAFRPASLRALTVALVLALQAAPIHAVDTGRPGPSPKDPPLDCTSRDNLICMECGQPEGLLACCVNGCDIIIAPLPPPPAPSRALPKLRQGLGSMRYFTR
jgi:hypothetical protein